MIAKTRPAAPRRQMAYQLTAYAFLELHRRLVAWFGERLATPSGYASIKDWIDQAVDGPEGAKLRGVLVVSIECLKNGLDPREVRKLVCWKGNDGKPGLVQAQFSGAKTFNHPGS